MRVGTSRRLFFPRGAPDPAKGVASKVLPSIQTPAEQVAAAAASFQRIRTGHAPESVDVVLGRDTVVITMHGALTLAERAMAATPAGAAQVQEFHRQLFAASSANLREDIRRITGVSVREAAAEVEVGTGAVVHAFTSGTMVQVFLLASAISPGTWSTPAPPPAAVP